MDASLRTLELMASEVGATVIVLREVVLVGGPAVSNARLTPGLSPSLSSSGISGSSITSGSGNVDDTDNAHGQWSWPVLRPDLDADGQPRVNVVSGKKCRGKLRRERRAVERERLRVNRRGLPLDRIHARARGETEEDGKDGDVPPFHLDLDEAPRSPTEPSPSVWKRREKGRWDVRQWRDAEEDKDDPFAALPFPDVEPVKRRRPPGEPMSKKQSAKAVKAAVRREQRRMDLYRGDGTGELWLGMEASHAKDGGPDEAELGPVVDSEGSVGTPKDRVVQADIVDGTGTPPPCVPSMLHPYQPARPSSLRLATPAPSVPVSAIPSVNGIDEEEPDPFLAELLLLPLDNLSLSFAEVRTVTDPYVMYDDNEDENRPLPQDKTRPAAEEDDLDDSTAYAPSPPLSPVDHTDLAHANVSGLPTAAPPMFPELICVEALVVRKTPEGVAGVQDWCEGGEDAWGFGYGYGGEGEGEEEGEDVRNVEEAREMIEEEDSWGF